ncbi:MAG: hypothetical protein ABFC96_14135 [Thermoguttaceae bacterium]
MAKKQKVNKSQAVRDYLKNNPKAKNGEIAAVLSKQGVEITPSYVANIKTAIKKATKKAKKVKPIVEVAEAASPAPTAAKPTKLADTITIEQIRAVVQTARAIGGFNRFDDLLELINDVGGLKKFRELVEAISMPDVDVIPF